MDVSPEHLVTQARERFQLQDYYGAIHLLEEVVATGRAFADAHHLLGLSYSLVGQSDKALEQFGRALQLNPRYVEALIHTGIVLNELGREDEAAASLRRASQVGAETRGGFPVHVAAKLANEHAALGEAYLEAGGLAEAIDQYRAALGLGPGFQDLRYKLGRMLLEAGRALASWSAALRAHAATNARASSRRGFISSSCDRPWRDERRPEDPRVEAYLAMLERSDTSGAELVSSAPPPATGRPAKGGRKKKK